MQFYKFKGLTINAKWSKEYNDRKMMLEKKRNILIRTSAYNQNQKKSDSFLFVNNISKDNVILGVIVRKNCDVLSLVTEYLKTIEIELTPLSFEEVTFKTLRHMLTNSHMHGYIDSDDEVYEQFELDRLNGKFKREIDFGEDILDDRDKESVYKQANKYPVKDTFIPELDRIYAGCTKSGISGHPVHYLIQTDNIDTQKEMCRLLLQALYANNRICNKRYCFLDFRPGNNFSSMVCDCLYKSNIGGTVIIRYLADDDTENNYASFSRDTIKSLCAVMKKYSNKVLTVFCLPRECKKAKDVFYENIGYVSIVELKEEFVYGECAVSFLKTLAKSSNIRTDKRLFAQLEDGKGYLASDLHDLFDNWYNNKLKTTVYPQYKDTVTAKHEIVKATPKGSAYDELNQMIGLDDAKKIINQSLNYFKAQKLFADKGMKIDRPAMHMVFTGNPGTAKTSVARLFAQIMKENGLLSKGDLIEVGRGDLVGKYVGWTAPTIQKKFKEAQGSVLFIDEAYSLVDDLDGSYGDEAISTIVQEMENHRDDVVVIFAGYPDKMECFLQKNPGLRSRIAYYVPFADYDTKSLCKIAKLIAKQKGLTLTAEAYNKLTGLFDAAKNENDFGNGRYVRNVIEKAKIALATRLLSMDLDSITSKDISIITAEDIEIPQTTQKPEKLRIGFCS